MLRLQSLGLELQEAILVGVWLHLGHGRCLGKPSSATFSPNLLHIGRSLGFGDRLLHAGLS